MSDMLKTFVRQEVKELVWDSYPHLRYPPCVYAKVVRVSERGGVPAVTLRILDKNKQRDPVFDDIPLVRTDLQLNLGDVVAAVLMYGEPVPYIIGRCY